MRRTLQRVGVALMAVVSMFLLCGAGYLYFTARNLDHAGKRLAVAVGRHIAGAPSEPPPRAGSGVAQNLLLVGIDDRSNMTDAEVDELRVGRDGGSMATDTMMLVHVPADGSRATLVSLPRDSYVSIPAPDGRYMGKLNGAYAEGYLEAQRAHPHAGSDAWRIAGINLLLTTVTTLTGVTIDHYVQVSLLGFYRLSNAMGGVSVDLCAAVDDTVEHNLALGGTGGSGFKMSAGPHTLQGVTALEFVRQRHNFPDGGEDLDRVRRQQYFLTQAFRQVATVGVITKLNAIKDAIQTSIVADPGLHLFDLAKQMENLTANRIVGATIPTSNAQLPDGTDILSVNPAQVRRVVDNLFNAHPATKTAPSDPSTIKPARNPSTSRPSTPASKTSCIN
ncbi:MAG: LCP family protein [Jatrophihabitans sp.]|uniref:LCP family protein n=1 Tax=Jatrophihabitans sp. TaxID=1932789 RepID=UPI003F81CED5